MKTNYLLRWCLYTSLHVLLCFFMTNSSYGQVAKCKGKYFGNIIANNTPSNYSANWNQATMENASKWQSVEGTRGKYNFAGSDVGFNWAKNNGGLFKYHTLMWGAQTPGWVSSATTATIQAGIDPYFKAVADHYNPMGGLKLIDVLNEPINTAVASNLKNALTAGYQAEPANAADKNNQYGWAIWCFQLARKYFPNTTLLINEYNVEMNWNNCRAPYIAMANAIKNAPNLTDGRKNLIDGVGLQCHGIDNLTAANFKACIDEIFTKTGLPVHITEFDQTANPNETKQRDVYSRLIPVAWEHPNVAGITLWGYIQGQTWIGGNGQTGASGTDSGIIYGNGQDRPAMVWLRSYLAGRPSLACCPAPAPFASCTNVNTAPTVSLTAPLANASFIAPANISITANAADADGTIASVAFYNGTTLLGTDATAPYSYSWTPVAAGTYSITARATDNAGAITTSTAVSITVTAPLNTAPTVSLTAPLANASFIAPATINITANAADADGTVSSVAFYNGTTLLGADATAPYSFSWTIATAGIYSITARATDNAGAITTSSAVSITVTAIPNTAPTVSLTAPTANASFIAPATISITATAADADGTIASVAFYNGTTLLGTDATAPYSFSWTIATAGTYSITARATDNAGAITTSAAVSITVTAIPNTAPTVSLTAPISNASFIAPATINITAIAADSDGTIASVAFYNGTTLLGTDATAPYSYSWTIAAAGTYSITARATDNAGAITTSAAVSITVTAPLNTAPIVSLTAPIANASFTAPATISITATAADADGTIASVAFYNGTTLLGTDATAPYGYSWTAVAAGTYSITARATDNAGAITTSAAVAVTVTGVISTDPILGPNCGSNNSTLSISLNSANRANVTSYNWWYTGSVASTTVTPGAPYSVTIQTGPYFSSGQVCVGTNLSVAPWYVQYCKTITKCVAARMGIDEFGVETLANVVIQPNPSADNFYLTAVGDISKLVIFNEMGVPVYEHGSSEKGTQLMLGQELAAGLYMVSIQYADGTNEKKRIVKIK